MIHYLDILNAVNRVNGWRDGFVMTNLERQLSQSLEVYKRRGEFDGTMDSAYKCLTLACYELEPINPHIKLKQSRNSV